MKLTILKTS